MHRRPPAPLGSGRGHAELTPRQAALWVFETMAVPAWPRPCQCDTSLVTIESVSTSALVQLWHPLFELGNNVARLIPSDGLLRGRARVDFRGDSEATF